MKNKKKSKKGYEIKPPITPFGNGELGRDANGRLVRLRLPEINVRKIIQRVYQ